MFNAKTFNDVLVFAGDNFKAAADVSYRNLVWETLPEPAIFFNLYTPAIVSNLSLDSL